MNIVYYFKKYSENQNLYVYKKSKNVLLFYVTVDLI